MCVVVHVVLWCMWCCGVVGDLGHVGHARVFIHGLQTCNTGSCMSF